MTVKEKFLFGIVLLLICVFEVLSDRRMDRMQSQIDRINRETGVYIVDDHDSGYAVINLNDPGVKHVGGNFYLVRLREVKP